MDVIVVVIGTGVGVRFPTVVSSCLDLPEQHDGGKDSYVLALRCFYYLQLEALPNRRVLLFTTIAIGLLAKRVWDRSLARTEKPIASASLDSEAPSPSEPIQRQLLLPPPGSGPVPNPPTTASPSSTTRFPQEIVDVIVAHLTHDTYSLLACSLTSRSWYIAAVPHLHCTLTTHISVYDDSKKTTWPRPLQAGSEFGWLPLITRLFITVHRAEGFSPEAFRSSTQREFSALTNVRELSIQYLDIPSFIPGIQWYFGQFSRTLRSLALSQPRGSDWQILFFIGLFPHLEDVELYPSASHLRKPADLILVPPCVPPLRGRLRVSYWRGDGLAKAMIDLFGGVRFRHMDLVDMDGTQLLLYSCANMLETFQLYRTNFRGRKLFLKGVWISTNDLTDRDSFLDYDLSQNKSLRELKITAGSLIAAMHSGPATTAPSSFRTVLSTIKSPAFSRVVIVYREIDFYNVLYSMDAHLEAMSSGEAAWYHMQFDIFREMCKARDFRLVLEASDVSDGSVQELKRAVAAETARGGLPPELSVTYTLRAS